MNGILTPALSALTADGRVAQDCESFGLDGLSASLAKAVDTHLELGERLIDLGKVLLGALAQGQVELPLIDHGITFAQLVIALGLETAIELFEILEHLGALSEEPGAGVRDGIWILDHFFTCRGDRGAAALTPHQHRRRLCV
jgi:hypothetical protein